MTVSIDGSAFNRNRGASPPSIPPGGGGGLVISEQDSSASVSATVINSTFKGNSGGEGGAITASGNVTIINSSIRRNRAFYTGGGIRVADGFALTLRNTIAWGNEAQVGSDLWADGAATIDADHCDVGDRVGPFNDLGGNINVDPLFTADLHLRAGSPAIDAGTCSGAPATDFEGDTRPTGASCDMGADEFVP